MFEWNVAQDMDVTSGEVKLLIAAGGGWRELVSNVDLYTGGYFNAVIYIDAPNEARPDESAEMIAAIKTRQGIWVKYAQSTTSGQYANMMLAVKDDPVQQAVGAHLKRNPGDNSYGYGAFPALAWKAFERMRPRFEAFLTDEVAPYLSRITGGFLDKIYIVGKAGTAGATGPGTIFEALDAVVQSLHRSFPKAGISVSERYLDGFGFEDCGPLIKKNASLSAARIHHHGLTVDLLDVEDRRQVLCTLSRDGKDRSKRDRHVAQLGSMLYSPRVVQEMRSTAINQVMGLDYGQFQIVIPVYYNMLNEKDLLAAAATVLLRQVTALTQGTDSSFRRPSPITKLQLKARTNHRPTQQPRMLLDSVKGAAAADDPRLLDSLVGRSANGNGLKADAQAMVVFNGGVADREAHNMILGQIGDAEQLIQRMSDIHLMIALVGEEMSAAKVKAEDARFEADEGRNGLKPLLQFTYGNNWHKARSLWHARHIVFHNRDDRVRTISDQADHGWELEEAAVQAEAELAVLRQLDSLLTKAKEALEAQFERLITLLSQISKEGIPFEDIELSNLNDVLVQLMYASSLPDSEDEVRDIIRASIHSVGMTTFARTLGYVGSEPVDAQHLASLIKRATPASVGMPWGGNSSYEGSETYFLLLPLKQSDITEVEEHLRKLNRGQDFIVAQLICGAGVFMGGLRLVQVNGPEDIETETISNILAELGSLPVERPGLKLLQGLIPGIEITNDPRMEIGRRLGLIPVEDATATDNQ